MKKIIVLICSVLFYSILVVVLILFNQENPIIPINKQSEKFKNYINYIIPEGFGFFTIKPHIKVTNLFIFDASKNKFVKSDYFPLANKKTFWGLNSFSRLCENDFLNVILHLENEIKINNKEGHSMYKLIQKYGTKIKYTKISPYKSKVLDGTYIISIQDVIPYEWRNSLNQDKMSGYFIKVKINS